MPELPPPSDPVLIEGAGPGAPPPPGRPVPPAHPEPSLGDLLRELTDETKHLVRAEVALAKTEAADKAKKAGSHIAKIVAGGLLAYAGLIVTLIGLGTLLGTVLGGEGFAPELGNEFLWLGLLIVGVLTMVIGALIAQGGIKGLKNTDFSLERTSRTLSDDKQFVQEEAREVKRDPNHLGASPSAQL